MMFHMTATVCAFCQTHAHMTPKWGEEITVDEAYILQIAASCDHCGRASLAVAYDDYNASAPDPLQQFTLTLDSEFRWFPRAGSAPAFPDVPDHIARAAKEAHAAESIGSLMSAVLMARTVVEATAKAKGITTGMLWAKIDAMADQSFIRVDTKEAAHEIRHFGNDMAHGDIEDLPDAADVRDVLVLMDEILSEVFQGPARTARLRNRRATR